MAPIGLARIVIYLLIRRFGFTATYFALNTLWGSYSVLLVGYAV